MRHAATRPPRETILLVVVAISAGVYLYNVIRFALFNNAFDPWYHAGLILQDEIAGTPAIDSYLGFPGLHILVGYLASAMRVPAASIITFLPVFTGTLSTLVMIVFVRWVLDRQGHGSQDARHHANGSRVAPDTPATIPAPPATATLATPGTPATPRAPAKPPAASPPGLDPRVAADVVLLAALLNTTISLYSLVSSGMFWGQMFTASLLPLVVIKFVEMNNGGPSRAIAEFLACAAALTIIHHLTSFFLITYLTACQVYLLVDRKASIKAVLATFLVVILFLIRYDLLRINLGIISYFTQDRTAYFYQYFVLLIAAGIILAIAKATIPRLARHVATAPTIPRTARVTARAATSVVSRARALAVTHRPFLVALFVAGIAAGFLLAVFPAITGAFQGLAPSWFLYYGANLFLLAPLAIAGVLAFGALCRGSVIKVAVYSWLLVVLGVLLAMLLLTFLGIGVGSLEFGRLTTFIYPFMAALAGFAAIPLAATRATATPAGERVTPAVPVPATGTTPATSPTTSPAPAPPATHPLPEFAFAAPPPTSVPRRSRLAIRIPRRVVLKAAILVAFCVLVPVTIVGVVAPPEATLTRYWNTPSEQATVSWIQQRAPAGARLNVDYHVHLMAGYYGKLYRLNDSTGTGNGVAISVSPDYYFLDDPSIQASLAGRNGTLILVDEVQIHHSLSYSGAGVEHGTLPALGDGFLARYDNLTFLNKIHDSGHEWLYVIR